MKLGSTKENPAWPQRLADETHCTVAATGGFTWFGSVLAGNAVVKGNYKPDAPIPFPEVRGVSYKTLDDAWYVFEPKVPRKQ